MMLSVNDLQKTQDPSTDEIACGNHILEAASKLITEQFAADPSLRTFEIPRKPLAKDAKDATGQTVTPKVRAYMIENAKAANWTLDPLGGEKSDKLNFSMKRKGGGRKPDTAEQKAAKAQAKLDKAAEAAPAADATPETDAK